MIRSAPAAKRFDLRTFAHTAKHRGDPRRQIFGINPHIFLDLNHQLPCRRNDQPTNSARLGGTASLKKLREDRQNERGRFTGTGLRDSDQVMPSHYFRDRFHLDRSRFRVPGFLDRFE